MKHHPSAAAAVAVARRVGSFSQHARQRLDMTALRFSIQRVCACERGKHIDQVVFGLIFNRHMLMVQRLLHRIVEELPQIHHGNS
jgi:hypothetical protein